MQLCVGLWSSRRQLIVESDVTHSFFSIFRCLARYFLVCGFSHLKYLSENATGSREEERRNDLQCRQLIEQFSIAGQSKHSPAGATTFSLSHGRH